MASIGRFVLSDGRRQTWSSWLEYFAVTLNYTTAVNTLWRFPYIVYVNGGRAYFLPFVLFTIFLGFPLIFIESSLGQFTSSGPIRCWRLSPFLQGIGAAMLVTSGIVAIYYSNIVSVAFYYVFVSMTSKLPWAGCGNNWNTESCKLENNITTVANKSVCHTNGWTASDDGRCYDETYNLKAYWGSASLELNKHVLVAADEYFSRRVLRSAYSDGLDDLGSVVWQIALLSLFVWLVVAVILSKSIWLYGKVSVVTKGLHFILLAVFFIYGLTLDGHKEGYQFYHIPDDSKLKEYKVWYGAGVQVFYGLSISFGGLSTFASYNKFENDTIRDSLLLCFVNIAVNALSGVVVFFLFGALAMNTNTSINEVVDAGPHMAFVAIPALFAIGSEGFSVFALLWFFMLSCMTFGCLLGLVETVITGILDAFPRLRRLRVVVVSATCVVFFLAGLPLTTEGGQHYLTWLDVIAGAWQMFTLTIVGLIAVLIYGLPRLFNDVEVMIGSHSLFCIPISIMKIFTGIPILTSLLGIVFMSVIYRVDYYDSNDFYRWPKWATSVGDLIVWTTPVLIICGGIYAIIEARHSISKDWLVFLFPMKDWGPVCIEHRARVASYVPLFNVGVPNEPTVEMSDLHHNQVA